MLTLSSHRAYLYHPGLEEWMCCAEEAHAGSLFMPTSGLRLENRGAAELGERAGVQEGGRAGGREE